MALAKAAWSSKNLHLTLPLAMMKGLGVRFIRDDRERSWRNVNSDATVIVIVKKNAKNLMSASSISPVWQRWSKVAVALLSAQW